MAEPSGAETIEGTIETANSDDVPTDPADDTPALVELARGGDSNAYALLVARYERQVRIYLARLIGDDAQASDLAQEVFVRAWQHLLELREPARFRAWLFRMATNAGRGWLRRRRLLAWISLDRWRETHDRGEGQRLESAAIGAGDLASFEERLADQEVLATALRRVPLDYRACLLLHAALGFTVAEVARQLDLTPGAVRMRLNRGLRLLREAYLAEMDEMDESGQS